MAVVPTTLAAAYTAFLHDAGFAGLHDLLEGSSIRRGIESVISGAGAGEGEARRQEPDLGAGGGAGRVLSAGRIGYDAPVMCGRVTLTSDAQAIADAVGAGLLLVEELAPLLEPRYNLSPMQEMLCARRAAGDPRLHPARLRWGLLPSWSREDSGAARMINARAESVFTKPAFRAAARARRCVAIADGFYEWRRPEKGPKAPYLFRLKGGRPFAIAALWECWRGGKGEPWLETCALLTTGANEMTRPVHDRMPVILAPEGVRRWTDLSIREPDALAPVLRPFDSHAMEAWPVSTRVNNPRNDDARLTERVEASGGGGSLF